MRHNHSSLLVTTAIFILWTSLNTAAQSLVATVPVGVRPSGVAINTNTNKIYVLNTCLSYPTCDVDAIVTVIDGATLSTTDVTVGIGDAGGSASIAVNQTTNKIYVANSCGNDTICRSNGTVTVIDGTTLSMATVTVGYGPSGVAVNETTNKVYVVNHCGDDPSCQGNATVTMIDGVTLATGSVTIQASTTYFHQAITLNPVTNTVYVTNPCATIQNCSTSNDGTVTVIDGATLATQTVAVQTTPEALAVNTVTNKIYVVNSGTSESVTVIDGATLSTTNVTTGGVASQAVAINQITNKIYVANYASGSMTVIDGVTLATRTVTLGVLTRDVLVNPVTNRVFTMDQSSGYLSTVDGITLASANLAVGRQPFASKVNTVTDRVYVANWQDNTLSVIDATPPTALRFVPATPCRVADTRLPDGPFGGPPIQSGTYRTFALPQNPNCGIAANAAAYSLNVTVVPHGALGYLTVWPAGQPQPTVSTLNSADGRIRANAAIVPAGSNAAINVFATDTTDVVLDIDGYFVSASGGAGLAFYPLAPCRVADTRDPNGPLGGPFLPAQTPRSFPVLQATSCNIPDTAQAYSLNFTAAPHGRLGYLSVWPTGQMQPLVSTLNAPTGTVVANAAIVPAGSSGEISAYASNDTDLIIDINGYFAAPGQAGLSLYAVAPCRVLDTRSSGGNGFNGLLFFPILSYGSGIGCDVWSTAQAFVFNATVVPDGPLGYLTLWPYQSDQPTVSTLNARDGAITSNMAIVPGGSMGGVSAYAYGTTNLIVDVPAYFGP
jgi:YVTN family beta-propeller protein